MSYYLVMTDNSTKSGSYIEFQDGRQVLSNTSINHIYHNEGLKPMIKLSTYPESQNMVENVIFAGFNGSHFEF